MLGDMGDTWRLMNFSVMSSLSTPDHYPMIIIQGSLGRGRQMPTILIQAPSPVSKKLDACDQNCFGVVAFQIQNFFFLSNFEIFV
jgi:hypothetical protein